MGRIMKRNYRNHCLKLMIFLVVGALTLTASTPLAINISTRRVQEDSTFVSTCAGENEFIFTFKTPKITQTEITTDYGAFSLLTPSSGFIGALGKPQIPVWTQLYAVPSDQVTLEILETVPDMVVEGMTERDLCAKIYNEIYKVGRPSFTAIIATGPNTADPHHNTGNSKIKAGQDLERPDVNDGR